MVNGSKDYIDSETFSLTCDMNYSFRIKKNKTFQYTKQCILKSGLVVTGILQPKMELLFIYQTSCVFGYHERQQMDIKRYTAYRKSDRLVKHAFRDTKCTNLSLQIGLLQRR